MRQPSKGTKGSRRSARKGAGKGGRVAAPSPTFSDSDDNEGDNSAFVGSAVSAAGPPLDQLPPAPERGQKYRLHCGAFEGQIYYNCPDLEGEPVFYNQVGGATACIQLPVSACSPSDSKDTRALPAAHGLRLLVSLVYENGQPVVVGENGKSILEMQHNRHFIGPDGSALISIRVAEVSSKHRNQRFAFRVDAVDDHMKPGKKRAGTVSARSGGLTVRAKLPKKQQPKYPMVSRYNGSGAVSSSPAAASSSGAGAGAGPRFAAAAQAHARDLQGVKATVLNALHELNGNVRGIGQDHAMICQRLSTLESRSVALERVAREVLALGQENAATGRSNAAKIDAIFNFITRVSLAASHGGDVAVDPSDATKAPNDAARAVQYSQGVVEALAQAAQQWPRQHHQAACSSPGGSSSFSESGGSSSDGYEANRVEDDQQQLPFKFGVEPGTPMETGEAMETGMSDEQAAREALAPPRAARRSTTTDGLSAYGDIAPSSQEWGDFDALGDIDTQADLNGVFTMSTGTSTEA